MTIVEFQFRILADWEERIQSMLEEPARYVADEIADATKALEHIKAIRRTGKVDTASPRYLELGDWVCRHHVRYGRPLRDPKSRVEQHVEGRRFLCSRTESLAIDIAMADRDDVSPADFHKAVWDGPYINNKTYRAKVDDIVRKVNKRLHGEGVRLTIGFVKGKLTVSRPPPDF